MSRQRTAKELCERALRAIGEFPITESAASPEHLREAMEWLDMILAERAAVTRIFSLIPATLSVPIVNGLFDPYNLNTALGADLPLDRVQFPVEAWIEDQAGNRYDCMIAQRQDFENVPNAATATGRPTMIHIDRIPTPTLRFYPVAAATDSNTYTLKLIVQTYAPNVSPGGVTGNSPSGSVLTNFRQGWQRWIVSQLSHDLGSGPIVKLPDASLNRFAGMASQALAGLLPVENQEHDTEPPIADDAFDDGDRGPRDGAWSTLG
jgi:hypothetical protein